MNKVIYVIMISLCVACHPSGSDVNELIKTDKEFSAMCMEKGMAASFMEYAADDVIKMRPQEYPIMGKKELQQMFEEHKGEDLKFSWEPVKADIAASGDLGYTFGNWKIVLKGDSEVHDTTLYGNYISIWKKQKDGSWKFELDGGNATPAPQQ